MTGTINFMIFVMEGATAGAPFLSILAPMLSMSVDLLA